MELESELSVAVCQMTSSDSRKENWEQIKSLLHTLPNDVDLVCLPEYALHFRIEDGARVPAIRIDDEMIRNISQWSQTSGATVHVGSVPLATGDNVYNASLVIRPDGVVKDAYRKIHLFDAKVSGAYSNRESDIYTHGVDPSIFVVNGWRIGCAICYDVRFSELFYQYAMADVDVILLPAAFLVQTGRSHWVTLLRARAIESQAYVLAAAQGGTHCSRTGAVRSTYGHSMIVDPWGDVLASVSETPLESERIIVAKLAKGRIQEVRAQIPMKLHRRLTRNPVLLD